ncbi:MAG: hypothetical protein OWQ48_02035 [Desulfurococcus sp.]|nr:hypothetical protein [Desulfurococcus sp.]
MEYQPALYYPGDLAVNYDYYIKRTTHESSLSIPMYATAAAIIGKHGDALELFKRALRTDTEDYYGNTRDGFHVAAAGGLWWIILHGFLGVKFKGGKAVIGRERLQGGIQVSSPLISIQ